ncbi:MAG: XRE family transcriptional regulator [Candidatus Eisenbacteria bacterium]|nr:XRE family transcriptional regulator [Candidatus Eisenbacteria bacterium]
MDDSMNTSIDRAELGQRVRDARHRRGMTLKDLDQAAGLSATHISEIERGKTSPTIGVLIRIAGALGREASYFVEPEVLPDVSITRASDRVASNFGPARIRVETSGIPGGRLQAVSLSLDGDRNPLVIGRGEGSLGAFVLSGSIRFETGAGVQVLEPGDSIYVRLEEPIRIASTGGPAELFAVTTAPLEPGDGDTP